MSAAPARPYTTSTGFDLVAEWVAALQSGEYKQVRDVYRANDCFCATGVLHDLVCFGWSNNGVGHNSQPLDQVGACQRVPLALCIPFTTLTQSDPLLAQMMLGCYSTAMDLNDRIHCSFREIAEHIANKCSLTPKQIAAGRARLLARGVLKGGAR